MRDTWALAIETLCEVGLRRHNERSALRQTAERLGITDANAIRVAYGLVVETERRLNVIDTFIDSIIRPKKLNAFNFATQAFLRLYVCQTRVSKNWADPDLAEAQRIAKVGRAVVGWKTLRAVEPFLGFLLTRTLEPLIESATDEERIAIRTFQPTWFVKYCISLFGRGEALAILEGNIFAPPTFIRLNTLKASEEEILTRLGSEFLGLEKVNSLGYVYKVSKFKRPLSSLTSYHEGLFYVQDKSSCFAVEAADPKPDMTVLDVSAAPGAKTTHLVQLMRNQGTVYSVDFSMRRMRTWKQETRRMGTKIAEPVIADARGNLPLNGEADVVLLDPPCTGTCEFGRQPSAKWRLSAKSAETMAEIQWQMINSVAESVKPRGLLVYTTGSLMVEENEMIIERFLKWHPEFSLVEIKPELGLPGLRGLEKCRRLYPHLHECSGSFISKLKKD